MPSARITGPQGSYLTPAQVEVLLRPLAQHRVHTREGQSNMEAWDIRAMLTRVFGFGRWSDEALEPTTLLYEQETTTKQGKAAYKIAYRATRRLTVCAPNGEILAFYDGTAVGEAVMPDFKRGDGHDFAIKKAESQALKRCAINLGTQFGLSLYRDGSLADVVRITLVGNEEPSEQVPAEADGPGVGEGNEYEVAD